MERKAIDDPSENIISSCSLNLMQARELLKMFGGDESQITIARLNSGFVGPGLYAWYTEYAEEGCFYLGDD